jgi:hypothetical protein
MRQLEEIVNYYLTSDTNYALMITGEWGVGKTYYYKNILRHQIKDTPTFEDNSKKYKPILVSLFGLKSVEEIQTEIFLSLYPILKNKTVKLGASIGKSLIKGIIHLKNLGEYYDYVSEVEVDKGDWIRFRELVICFDDLERLSENLNIEEFIGYANSLVENENVKVLIIANENKIERHNYYALKEKVVGNSIEFIPDIGNSFDSLIEVKFGSFPLYKKFLNDNKGLILEIYTKDSTNLRILSFALLYFNRVFSEVINQISSCEILNDKTEEILLALLKFSLSISIEYKEGRITYKKKHELYSGEFDWPSFSFDNVQFGNTKNEKNVDKKTSREKFIEKYYPDKSFIFFTSVFDFITGGSIFQFDELVIELKKHCHIKEDVIPPHYEVFNQLSYPKVFSLTDNDYKTLTKKLLYFSDRGFFDITNYLTVFYFSARFGNPLKYNLDKLEKRVINGMKKGKSNYKFQHSLEFYLNIENNCEHKERLIRIRKIALEINNEIDSTSKQIDSKRLEDSCYNNFQEFYEEVLKHDSQYSLVPIFINFNVNKFYQFFIKSGGETQWQVVRFWSNRYRDYPYSEFKKEIDFLEKLRDRLIVKLKRLPKRGLKNFIFNEHIKTLQTSIDGLNQTT